MDAIKKTYGESNSIAADAILEDVPKHGGECAGLVIWARMYLRNHRDSSCRKHKMAGPSREITMMENRNGTGQQRLFPEAT
jgi:hypothetical protein